MNIKTWNDLWLYICANNYGRIYSHYYMTDKVTHECEVFWDGILSALEMAEVITKITADNIWSEIIEYKEKVNKGKLA